MDLEDKNDDKKEIDVDDKGKEIDLGDKKSFEDIAKELKLEKFKDPAALGKAYKELQSKLGSHKALSDLSDEQYETELSAIFAKDKDVVIEDSKKGIVEALVQGGVSKRAANRLADHATNYFKTNSTARNKDEVRNFLQNNANKKRLEGVLKKVGGHDDFQKRFDDGQVSLDEVKLLSNLGSQYSEGATSGITTEPEDGKSLEALEKEYYTLIEDTPAYYQQKHPKYADLRKKGDSLKKRLGI